MPVITPDPLKGLKGINTLSQEEKNALIKDAYDRGTIKSTRVSSAQLDAIYRNKLYKDKYGVDAFNEDVANGVGLEQRWNRYRTDTIQEAFSNKYGKDQNFDYLNSTLTVDGKLDLIESGYRNEEEQQEYIKGLNKYADQEQEYIDKLGSKPSKSIWDNLAYGAAVSDGMDNVGGSKVMSKNTGKTLRDDTFAKAADQSKVIPNIVTKDNKRVFEQVSKDAANTEKMFRANADSVDELISLNANAKSVQDLDDIIAKMVQNGIILEKQAAALLTHDVASKTNLIGQILEQTPYNKRNWDKLFDSVALRQTIETPDGEKYDYPGSRTYNALKDSNKLQGFNDSDKLSKYIKFKLVEEKYGTAKAIESLDTDMQKTVDDMEGFWDAASDVTQNIIVGGIANIANKLNAVNMEGLRIKSLTQYGDERLLTNRLMGKNPDGSEIQHTNYYQNGIMNTLENMGYHFWDPTYWEKVDHYNTLDPVMIKKIDENGGISPFVNMHQADEPLEFFSARTLQEGLKMIKFAWSDALFASVLGAAGSGLAEIGATSRVANRASRMWDIGTVAMAGAGIAQSYGMMTFDQTLQENRERAAAARRKQAEEYADSMMGPNADVEKEVNANIQALEKAQERKLTDEEKDYVRQQVEYKNREQLIKQWETDHKDLIEEDERMAQKAATHAYTIDKGIEWVRMSIIQNTFRQYLQDKGTLERLGIAHNRFAPVTFDASGKASMASKVLGYAKPIAVQVGSGFESNYVDDIVVAMGKGFGTGEYSDYIANKYNGDNLSLGTEASLSFIPGFKGMREGMIKGALDRQSFYDGVVGGLGSIVSFSPNLQSVFNNRAVKEEMNRADVAYKNLSWIEKFNMAVTNPLVNEVLRTRAQRERTAELLDVASETVSKNAEGIRQIGQLIGNANAASAAQTAGRLLEAKDAKEDQAFQLLYSLLGSEASPIIAQHPEVANALSTIERMSKGRISDQDVSNFLSRAENQDIASQSNAQQIARERLQKNAKGLWQMSERIREAESALSKVSAEHKNDPRYSELKEQNVYLLAKTDAAMDRANELEEQISGKKIYGQGRSFIDRVLSPFRKDKTTETEAIARYGNKENLEVARQTKADNLKNIGYALALNHNHLQETTRRYNKALEEGKQGQELENLKLAMLRDQQEVARMEETARSYTEDLGIIKKLSPIFDKEEGVRVLSEEEILNLSPEARETILNKKNRGNYSKEQQEIIDRTIEDLKAKDANAAQNISDVAKLTQRVKDNQDAYRALQANPEGFFAYADMRKQKMAADYRKANTVRATNRLFKDILDNSETKEQAVNYLNSIKDTDLGRYANSANLQLLMREHPELSDKIGEYTELLKLQEKLSAVIKQSSRNPQEQAALVSTLGEAAYRASDVAEAMSNIEDVIAEQTDETAKRRMSEIYDELKSQNYQVNTTKQRQITIEKKRRERAAKKAQAKVDARAEEKKRIDNTIEEERKRFDLNVGDEINFNINGKPSNGKIDAFTHEKNGDNIRVLVKVNYKTIENDGINAYVEVPIENVKKGHVEVKAEPAPAKTETKEEVEEQVKEEKRAEEVVEEVAKENASSNIEMVESGDVDLFSEVENPQEAVQQAVGEVVEEVDESGEVESPTAMQQATEDNVVITVPAEDSTDQGNVLEEGDDVISGNRLVQISLDKLVNDGVVTDEVLSIKNSDFDRFLGILDKLKAPGQQTTRLQEIIDNEFQKILLEKPDTKVYFMRPNFVDSKGNPINMSTFRYLINVIEYDATAKKYHKHNRGGIFQAGGKSYLIVGTTGFDNNATKAQQHIFNTMKAPINAAAQEFFKKDPTAQFFVHPTISTTVQATSSGRVVKQTESQPKGLWKLSELLGGKKQLGKAQYGIQTRQPGERGFVLTRNAKGQEASIFPPRDIADNVGRAFVLIKTPNGNKIPGMIEPSYFNNIDKKSQLYNQIAATLANVTSTNYDVRKNAITQLCGMLVLSKKGKNILVGNEKIHNITIKNAGKPDRVFDLGKNFDRVAFQKAIEDTNFQINIPIKALENQVLLEMYDDAGALMTNVKSTETIGSSYTIYMTDNLGRPIMKTPVASAKPRTGDSNYKTSRIVLKINNKKYTLKDESKGLFEDEEGNTIDPISPTGVSLYYNRLIEKGGAARMYVKKDNASGRTFEYFSVHDANGVTYVISRDSANNVTRLSQERSNSIIEEFNYDMLYSDRESAAKKQLSDLNAIDKANQEARKQQEAEEKAAEKEESVTQEQYNNDLLNGFDNTETSVEVNDQAVPVKEEVKAEETKVEETPQPAPKKKKKAIKSLKDLKKGNVNKVENNLENPNRVINFATEMASSETSRNNFLNVVTKKGWGITKNMSFMQTEAILKQHNVSTSNITNWNDWVDQIKNCK